MDFLRRNGKIYNDADFCVKVGKNRSHISELVNGKRTLTKAFVNDVVAVFPELNAEWLLNPDCTEMLRGNVEIQGNHNVVNNGHTQTVGSDTAALQRIIEKQQAQIDRLLGIIENLQK